MSAEKLLNVGILSMAKAFIRAAENYVSFSHHHDLTVYQTKSLAFALKNHCAFLVNYRVFRTEVIEVVHLVSYEYGRNVLKVAQLHRQFADGSRSRWI